MTQELLQRICFKVNNYVQDGITGSAAERFFRRKPKSLLPNSIEREVDWRSMITERTNKQAKLATSKKERKSAEEFKPGDNVIIQEHSGRKQWKNTGMIEQARISDDGSSQSFLITLDRGGSFLRNKHFKTLERHNPRGQGGRRSV